MSLADKLRGKVLWGPNRLLFGGGYPIYRRLPHPVRWGPYLSIFWLGCEMVIKVKHDA